MSHIKTDVLIIGGGPAGTSAAISVLKYGRDISVMLVEQSDLDQIRVGEHVSSSIFELLKYLSLEPGDFENGCFLTNHGTTSYWGSGIPMTRDAIFSAERPACQLDRKIFDLTLLKQVADLGGIVLPRTRCLGYDQLEDHNWQVKLHHAEQGAISVHAKFLIDASGRQRSASRLLNIPSDKHDTLFGIGAFLAINGRDLPSDQMMESTELGWWYSATLQDNYATTIFFTDSDIVSEYELSKPANWYRQLQQTKFIKKRITGFDPAAINLWSRSAHTHISNISNSRNFIAIGDAMASFDPISSMGIGFAISSACNAAAIALLELNESDANRIAVYQADVSRIFNNYLQQQKKVYQQEKRWPESSFWKRRTWVGI
ncbi:lysine-epsilon-oxidase maturase LodB [Mucilaginibacter sabulilitoris]|uniref:Lysine-epsilon-oxidase maturase LodB n=1 Tax=Mucilaginibacter sabulilitoris TaxID=1173583 RepID=A0ABZ0TJE8_9SPHI|nr:lysine-epsilon-oxidase maturase LodB [Mucilaginibacter sabulilitoris]WPU92811.1 lysine-epsilon-oxidase maturase LodB [Mucilaginibacter sabulilitoris]